MNELITNLTVKELAEKIHARELTCMEVATQLVNSIDKQRNLNTMIYFNIRDVFEQAAEMDREIQRGHFRGRLHGVPIMIKDNIHVKNIPNSAGTLALKNFIPLDDSQSVARLREAGCLILGKNNMHELAFGATSDNLAFGRVGNPLNLEYSAGGSSGGTGAAIAAHMAPAGLGSDTAGSVRIPASVLGICGFKPSLGRYPSDGLTPICYIRDTIGTLARTVDDLIILDEILSKKSFKNKINNLEGIRFGLSNDYLCNDLDTEVEQVFNHTKEILKKAGAIFIEIDFNEIKCLYEKCGDVLMYYGAKNDLEDYLQKYKINLTLNEIIDQVASQDVKESYLKKVLSNNFNLEDYSYALNIVRPKLIEAYHSLYKNYDLDFLIFPTLPCTAFKFSENNKQFDERIIRNTSQCSVSGMPGLSISMGKSSNGMPIGLEIDALNDNDELVLNVGRIVEKILSDI